MGTNKVANKRTHVLFNSKDIHEMFDEGKKYQYQNPNKTKKELTGKWNPRGSHIM